VGNILIFIPLGFLLPLIIKKKIKLLGILIICVITSFAIEILQGVTYIGVADIDDVLLYVLGAVIGYMIYIGVKKLIVLTLKEISIKNKRTS
jgi:glycopeptide antibiotics resistance protein